MILMAGYFGYSNTGDEAILASTMESLRRHHPDLEFCVLSGDPQNTEKLHGVPAVLWDNLPAVIQKMKECSLLLMGGGGIFHDYWGIQPDQFLSRENEGLTYYVGLPILAHWLGKPIYIYAVGVGPLFTEEGRKFVRLAFESRTLATLRDAGSLELVKDLGVSTTDVQITADPAFGLTVDKSQGRKIVGEENFAAGKPILGVCLRYWDQSVKTNWQRDISAALDRFIDRTDCSVMFIPFQTLPTSVYTDDIKVAQEVHDGMEHAERSVVMKGNYPPSVVAGLIAQCDLLLGMRLHSLIFAAKCGIPMVALSYDQKVSEMMSRFSLREYELDMGVLTAHGILETLERCWKNRLLIQAILRPVLEELSTLAERNAELAASALENAASRPSDPESRLADFTGDFAVKQISSLVEKNAELDLLRSALRQKDQVIVEKDRAIEKRDQTIAYKDQTIADKDQAIAARDQTILEMNQVLSEKKRAIDEKDRSIDEKSRTIEVQTEQLNSIYGSNFWKIASRYYSVMKIAPLNAIHTIFNKGHPASSSLDFVSKSVAKLNFKKLRGFFIVTSAFPFDELYNQRVINLSKFLSKIGWGGIFVAWRWSKNETGASWGGEVYKNIYQVPSDALQEGLEILADLDVQKKVFFAEFPSPEFLTASLRLRNSGYRIVYEIIDDWEAFYRVGQAPWFDGKIENAFVLNANYLTAVSRPLQEKFSNIRKDIHLIPNGFSPHLLGKRHQNLSRKKKTSGTIQVGYFGNLTEAWFDWEFIYSILEEAERRKYDLKFHLVGFGAPRSASQPVQFTERVFLPGPVKPSRLYQQARTWDASIIPFRPGPLAEAADPIKIYEYLYFGLPVIVRGITHLREYPNVHIVEDAKQFLDVLSHLEKSSDGSTLQFLAESTWEQRFWKLMGLLEDDQWMFL
jgi:polysaccharide pyruvyl transferase CsaB